MNAFSETLSAINGVLNNCIEGVRNDRCIRFRYGEKFDEQTVRKIAETARVKFEGMPGLRSKAFTLNSAKREASNFYIWDSEDAAKAFFTDELLDQVASLYGVRPSVEFVQIATLVENAHP